MNHGICEFLQPLIYSLGVSNILYFQAENWEGEPILTIFFRMAWFRWLLYAFVVSFCSKIIFQLRKVSGMHSGKLI